MTKNTQAIEIIAELAQGFEGDPSYAHLLLKAAAKAGANAAKFQLVYADELATQDYKYYDLFKDLEMEDQVWKDLRDTSKNLGLELHVDVFGPKSLELAENLNLTSIKLHGTDTTNLGFLERVAQSSIPRVFLGAGGAHWSEIKCALDVLKSKNVVIMLGFQGYPTPTAANHISRIPVLAGLLNAHSFEARVGFSEHADPTSNLSHTLTCAALGAGVRIVEKHLTLGRNMEMEDFEAALNPDEFSEFCVTVRETATAIHGCTDKDDFGMSQSEKEYRHAIRRHVIACGPIKAGTAISPDMVELKRSSEAKPIYDITSTYDKVLTKSVVTGEALTVDKLK